MPTSRENSIWGNIRVQLNDAQNLISRGRYQDAAVLNREILKSLVRIQIDKAVLVSGELEGDIDQLYDNRLIGAKTRDNYHRIRSIGDSGEGVSPEDANESFHLIREELSAYVDRDQPRRSKADGAAVSGGEEQPGEGAEEQPSESPSLEQPFERRRASAVTGRVEIPISALHFKEANPSPGSSGRSGSERAREMSRSVSTGRNTRNTGTGRRLGERPARPLRNTPRRNAAQKTTGLRTSGRNAGGTGKRRGTERQDVYEIDIYNILKIAVPILCLILLFFLIRAFVSGGSKKNTRTTAPAAQQSSSEADSSAAETQAPETTAPVTTESPKRYFAAEGLRVRTKPSTEGSEILTRLEGGTEVHYKGDYDNDWAIIDYNGQDAYVAKRYLRVEEAAAITNAAALSSAEAGTQATLPNALSSSTAAA
ncbi:SH3 domain protein [Oribacterium sp. oral taxon 078 str. F0262]|uniref:SH3 domain-containing protein n=1 Tax=Oribacterium sp. oral taxon 078 TaxID=652706 RepID=UPI0001BCBC9A|nr:SH3 domain-containing protein [Oribacterium sp. oral taxon 078]EFE92524.1 SH3 domain protein [Oribacterium sp. oral taxon 078 str. F0262]